MIEDELLQHIEHMPKSTLLETSTSYARTYFLLLVTMLSSYWSTALAEPTTSAFAQLTMPSLPQLKTNDSSLRESTSLKRYRGVKHAARVGEYIELSGSKFVVWGGEKSGVMPKGIAVTRDGKWVLASNLGRIDKHNISVYRSIPFKFERSISHSGNAIEILPSVDGKRIFVTNQEKYGYLDILDAVSLERVERIRITGFPKWMTESVDGKYLYLSLWSGNGVARINWSNGKIDKLKTQGRARHGDKGLSKHPRGMVITQDGKTLIMVNNSDRSLSLIDLATFKERKRMNISVAPRHVVLSPDGKTAVISETGRGIAFFDVKTEKVIKRVRVGKSPKSIVMSKDGRFVYVSDYRGHSLSIIDTTTYETMRMRLNILRSSGIDVHPSDSFIYISGWCTNDVWAIQRIDEGEELVEPMGRNRFNHPCYECEMPSTGCPSGAELRKHRLKK
jgi:DNA-binding beta-propeller fold protein YncE